MLTEDNITNLFVEYLKQNNYTDIKSITTKQKGFDIEAIAPNGKKFYVEVKGETSANKNSKRYNLPFNGNQIWNHGAVAVFTTLRSMSKPEHKDALFALVFPMNHEDMMLSIKDSMYKLGIDVYFVSEENVKRL